jgi:hypothetical protein
LSFDNSDAGASGLTTTLGKQCYIASLGKLGALFATLENGVHAFYKKSTQIVVARPLLFFCKMIIQESPASQTHFLVVLGESRLVW